MALAAGVVSGGLQGSVYFRNATCGRSNMQPRTPCGAVRTGGRQATL